MRATIAPVVTVIALVGVVLVLFAAAVLSTREGPVLADAPRDVPDLGLPPSPLQPEDVTAVRFDMALRGYRMSEVDEVLERLAADLRARDERIAALEAADRPSSEDRPQEVAAPELAAPEVAAPVAPEGAEPTDRPSSAVTSRPPHWGG